jgi:5-methyltetrahydrofolate--homocysteine methyltransferase
VKIAPAYAGPTIYVADASRAVPVVQKLLSGSDRDLYVETEKREQKSVRESYLSSQNKSRRLPIATARARALELEGAPPPPPLFLGVRALADQPLSELAGYIDWSPFFSAWDLVGRYPQILTDDIVGDAARALYGDAKNMLARMIEEKWVRANGVVGFWPANRRGDDIVLWTDDTRTIERARLFTLRQQMEKGAGPNLALADFISEDGADHIGAFAVTAGIGEAAVSERFRRANDDYSAIMVKALTDRFAEAFAEYLHARVRREFWAYAPGEALDVGALIAERYEGIRPAPGYPAQPDHTEKATLFDLLDARSLAGMDLTESLAMTPPASVSGLYFARPEAEYFGVGRIDRDQVADYAARKSWSLSEAERRLSPILAYEPV